VRLNENCDAGDRKIKEDRQHLSKLLAGKIAAESIAKGEAVK
jgi:hypothetical protein